MIELDPAERARRLEEIPTADSDLRDAVGSLLAAEAVADERLRELEPSAASAEHPPQTTRDPDPFGLTGRTLSHFRVLEPIEAGGMGVVYRAEDTRLDRVVALKFLLPQFHLDTTAKQRFLHEARSAAPLDHPNLCTIHEVGESEQGQLFLAMPSYPGETLRTRLAREGALPIEEALGIACQSTQGLAVLPSGNNGADGTTVSGSPP